MNNLVPAEVFPPGEFIRDELEARGWTQQDLADILGVTTSSLSLIINGKRSLTPETAKAIGEAFGTSPEFWLNLENAYQLSRVKVKTATVADRARLYSIAPVGEMVRRGWLKGTDNVAATEDQLKHFFACESLDEIRPLAMAARKSADYTLASSPAERAWGYRVLRLGRLVNAAKFDAAALSSRLPELRAMTLHPENLRKLPTLLANWGVRLALVSHLEKTYLDGATLWLDEARTQPVVGLSLRFDRIDWFWFTLMHELVHVVHREASIDADLVPDAKGEGGVDNLDEMERRANAEAASLLVPQEKLESFIIRTRPFYAREKVIRFAQAQAVHPGIVVGQLHRRKEIPPKNLRDLLVQNGVRSLIVGQTPTDGWGHEPGVF